MAVAISLSSCMVTRTNVGAFREEQGHKYTYSKAKQLYLFWGVVRLGSCNAATPATGNCQVKTAINFGDVLISGLTGGILSSQTVKVIAKRPEKQSAAPAAAATEANPAKQQ